MPEHFAPPAARVRSTPPSETSGPVPERAFSALSQAAPAARSPSVARASAQGHTQGLRAESVSGGRGLQADPSVLRVAAARGDTAALESLLSEGVDVNARDAHGRTALLQAVQQGQLAAVETLLAHGADANAADDQGATPLGAARAAAEPAIAAVLRRYGAR